ncbi:MAG: hypothetical protein QOE45_1527 [Frankiaceae bacterium]|nr:hypothetical protein [Frankiaceae bacterium]
MKPRTRRAATAAALVMTTCLAAPAPAAGCPGLRAKGAWSLADEPYEVDVANGANITPLTHVLGFPQESFHAGGGPGRIFLNDGVTLRRTTDKGCTWQRAYSIDPTAVTATASDPAVAVAISQLQYTIIAVATQTRPAGASPAKGAPDPVYILMANTDGWFTGLGQNTAGVFPYLLAHSMDGGTTWQTDLLRVRYPWAPEPVPLTGNGLTPSRATAPVLVVSATDPRTAYVVLDARDAARIAGALPAAAIDGRGLYVTHDAGASWSFASAAPDDWGGLVADPLDGNVLYVRRAGGVDMVTVGAKTVRRGLIAAVPGIDAVTGVDVEHVRGRPARILVGVGRYDAKLQRTFHLMYLSTDGGRRWLTVAVPPGGKDDTIAGGHPWLAAGGDVVLLLCVGPIGNHRVALRRWSSRTRTWGPQRAAAPPLSAGLKGLSLTGMIPADSSHRTFLVRGLQEGPNGVSLRVVGTFDERLG